MIEEREHIDEIVREKLFNYSVEPPKGEWRRIESGIHNHKKRSLLSFFMRAAAVGAVIIAFTVLYLFNGLPSRNNNPEPAEIVGTSSPDQNEETETMVADNTEMTEVSTPVITTTGSNENVGTVISYNEAPLDPESIQEESNVAYLTADETEYDSRSELNNISLSTLPIQNFSENDENISFQRNTQVPVISSETKNTDVITAMSNSEEFVRKSKLIWSVGGQAGPQYTYRDVFQNDIEENGSNDYDEWESAIIAYAGGINIQVEGYGRFAIQSGIYYSKIGTSVNSRQYSNSTFASMSSLDVSFVDTVRSPGAPPAVFINSTGDLSFDEQNNLEQYNDLATMSGSINTQQYFEFVEIPLILKYKFLDRKLDMNIAGGLFTHFLVGNKAVATGNDDLKYHATGKTENVNSFNYSGSLSIGIDYPIVSNLTINLEPIFKYYLSPINNNPETEVYPYSFGIMTGVRYTF